jgi:hypothetical protein
MNIEQPHHGLHHHRRHRLPVGPSVLAIRPNVSNNAAGSVPGGTSEDAAEHSCTASGQPAPPPPRDTIIVIVRLPIHWAVEKRQEGSGWVMNWMEILASFEKTH